MLKRWVLVAGTVVACTAMTSPTRAANGCPDGTANTTASGGGAFSTLFDAFFANGGTRTECSLTVATGSTNAGQTIRVYSADYRGVMTLGNSDRGTLSTQQGTGIDPRRFGGPYDGDLDTRTYVGTDRTGNIASTIALDLSDASDPFAFGAVDSVDYSLVASTTRGDIKRSLDRLADDRTASLLGIQSLSGLLAGTHDKAENENSFAIIAALGSPLAGVRGRYAWDNGISASGGVAYFEQDVGDTENEGALVAGSLRYMASTASPVRPYGEIGARLAPYTLEFTRRYDAGTGSNPSIDGSADALTAGAYLEGGFVVTPNDENQIIISATYSHDRMRVDAMDEGFGPDNLFAASFARTSSTADTLGADIAWTTRLMPNLEVGLNAGGGYAFADGNLDADVTFAGDASGKPSDMAFATYGAKISYNPTVNLSATAFVKGITTEHDSITPAIGGSLQLRF